MTNDTPRGPRIASLGGGHGLYRTLEAARRVGAAAITAIVTVADDGGSSGRIRRELGSVPPGDLRMALVALTDGEEPRRALWARLLQRRFGGHGALAGHAVGNLILAGLAEELGSMQAALDEAARALDARGRVVPVVDAPLDIEADVCGLGGDPRIMRLVRGQVAVASTPGQVRRVRIVPDDPTPNPEALRAIRDADLVTIGPGSWFSSVIPHLLVPGVVDALAETSAVKVVVVNLAGEPGETQDFSTERHIHMLRQQAPDIRADYVLVDPSAIPSEAERDNIRRAAAGIGARLAVAPVRRGTSAAHDPETLARALAEALRGS